MLGSFRAYCVTVDDVCSILGSGFRFEGYGMQRFKVPYEDNS